jgi:haloacid dehalogenase superfamily, subfamily IA, variant 1 with third motif having Dx(3-4)D or Dx(3-4)E
MPSTGKTGMKSRSPATIIRAEMIKVIFFDAAGTLFHLTKSPGEHYAEVARQQGIDLSPEILDRAFLRAWKQAPIRAAISGPRLDDDKGWWRELVDVVFADYPGLPTSFDRHVFFESAYRHFAEPGVWTLYRDVKETLVQLAPHFELGIISNFDQRLHLILEHVGIARFFNHVFLSSQLGADKPDLEIYRRALAISGFPTGEAMHVGDDPERDWRAAAEAGLRVFKLDRGRNSLPDLLNGLSNDGPVLLRPSK